MARPPNWRDIGPWNKTNETRDEFAIRTLDIAFNVHFDEDDREFHGDIRYDDLQRNHNRTLASKGGRWRDNTIPLEPLKVEDLTIGETYKFRQLPLGSKFIMNETEQVLNHYNYAPRPSKGATISTDLSDENNGFMTNKGLFTALGDKEVIFVSHPHKRNKHAKSAAATRARSRSPSPSPKASVKTPSPTPLYKTKAKKRRQSILSRKRTRRRKRGSRARTVSADKVKVSKSPTRRRRTK